MRTTHIALPLPGATEAGEVLWADRCNELPPSLLRGSFGHRSQRVSSEAPSKPGDIHATGAPRVRQPYSPSEGLLFGPAQHAGRRGTGPCQRVQCVRGERVDIPMEGAVVRADLRGGTTVPLSGCILKCDVPVVLWLFLLIECLLFIGGAFCVCLFVCLPVCVCVVVVGVGVGLDLVRLLCVIGCLRVFVFFWFFTGATRRVAKHVRFVGRDP